jgi:heme oxygenase
MDRTSIRNRLREATSDVHERLHGHAGFSAAAAGTISVRGYGKLLERLWGFHRAFESTFDEATRKWQVGVDLEKRHRCGMIEADLITLGGDLKAIARLPQCVTLYRPGNKAAFIGALYVVEGSTLGGVHLARALASTIGAGSACGVQFFLGYGDQRGAMWRSFLQELDECARAPADEAAVIDGAIETFVHFEAWMEGWNSASSLTSGSSLTPKASAFVD